METAAPLKRSPRALWVFGLLGSGKSTVLARLPLAGFPRVDTDAELEAEMCRRAWPTEVARYDPAQAAAFRVLRGEVLAIVWDRVPAWRVAGRDLAFETTGNKPDLFHAELEAERALGYASFGCALATSLADCLARNAGRPRVLPEATFETFQRELADGTYRRIFRAAQLGVCESIDDAVERAESWLMRTVD